jgi:hypothetical protein
METHGGLMVMTIGGIQNRGQCLSGAAAAAKPLQTFGQDAYALAMSPFPVFSS